MTVVVYVYEHHLALPPTPKSSTVLHQALPPIPVLVLPLSYMGASSHRAAEQGVVDFIHAVPQGYPTAGTAPPSQFSLALFDSC